MRARNGTEVGDFQTVAEVPAYLGHSGINPLLSGLPLGLNGHEGERSHLNEGEL
jgi:hypothetical protein